MGIYLSQLGLPYSVWNAVCAVLFPILAAIAVFICLRRASGIKKLITFFVSSAVYVVCAVFLFEFIARSLHILRYDLVGFMLSVAAGMIYLELCVLICGIGIMRKRGIIVSLTVSAVLIIISAITVYFAEAGACSCAAADGTCTAIHRIPFLAFLPSAVSNSGIEFVSVSLLVLFLIAYFLCFLANKKPEEIRRDDISRRRIKALADAEDEEKKDLRECGVQIDRCCAYCEFARPLYGDGNNILCDKKGIVDADHICRAFIYDPLKRAPARPVADLSDAFGVVFSDNADGE